MNSFLIALVILELVIDIFWSIKYYKLKSEFRSFMIMNKLINTGFNPNDN